jgi:hypothetical protein
LSKKKESLVSSTVMARHRSLVYRNGETRISLMRMVRFPLDTCMKTLSPTTKKKKTRALQADQANYSSMVADGRL